MKNAADYLAHLKALIIWDNAAHHPDVETYPHHVHQGNEENVKPYPSITAEELLTIITSSEEE
jgi:hypothetical protein